MKEYAFNKRIAMVIIVALLINAALSTYAHLFIFHFSIVEWLLMNMCAPSSIAASIGLIFYFFKPNKSNAYFLLSITNFLFTFPIIGFFLPSAWTIGMIQAQVTHFIMIFTGIYIIYFVYKDQVEGDIKSMFLKGFLPGLIVMAIIILVAFPIFFEANPNIWLKYQFY